MAYNRNNGNSNSGSAAGGAAGSGGPAETEELSAEDYAIIAAGLGALGEIFAFLSLVKAKQVTKETGGQAGVPLDPVLFVQSRMKKAARRKSRRPR